MPVWTISFEAGSGGELVARELAECAQAPLIDRQAVLAIAHAFGVEIEDADHLEHHPPGSPLEKFGLGLAALAPLGASAVAELVRQPTLRAVTERVVHEAARQRCVVLGRGGFIILADHPGAIHIRLHAPLEWRTARYAREECVSREEARKALLAEDRARDAYLRRLYGRHFADLRGFHLVIDASRFSTRTIVEMALVAGGVVPSNERPSSSTAFGVEEEGRNGSNETRNEPIEKRRGPGGGDTAPGRPVEIG
ncbi:MAG TPA: cytidylate kinase-like family protein [Gaiellaceae bacterium]|nr:cytidylate kinase-like family protein [Gaiellaceae bacterium]